MVRKPKIHHVSDGSVGGNVFLVRGKWGKKEIYSNLISLYQNGEKKGITACTTH